MSVDLNELAKVTQNSFSEEIRKHLREMYDAGFSDGERNARAEFASIAGDVAVIKVAMGDLFAQLSRIEAAISTKN